MTVWAWQSYYSTRVEPVPTPEILAVADLVRAACKAGEEHGACHVVLSDINLEKCCVAFSLAQRNITPAGIAAMEAMMGITMRERAIAICLAQGETFCAWSDAEWDALDHDEDDDPPDMEA